MTASWDAIVIGGGPGGCAAATTLARAGRRVLLLEREVFPRYHVGESLSPAAGKALDAIGVGGEVREAGFNAKTGATFVWGRDRRPWSIYYGQPNGAPAALQVERAAFDDILLRHAGEAGVDVRQGCHVDDLVWEAGRVVGVSLAAADGTTQRLSAAWIVDASGQDAFLARRLGLLELCPQLAQTAVWSYWTGAKRLPGDDAGNSLYVGGDGFALWCIPLQERMGGLGVGMVLGPSMAQRLDDGVERLYHEAIGNSAVLSDLLSGARQVGPVRTGPAEAYCGSRLAGPGWLLVGDAACFVDPILSPGVQMASQHGVLAARTLNTVLDDPDLQTQALAYYDQCYRRQYDTFVRLCLNLYGGAGAAGDEEGARPGAQGAPGPPGQPPPAPGGDRLTFLALISGLPAEQLPPLLGRYLGLRKRAEALGGAPVHMGEQEGFDFLTRRFAEHDLAESRTGGNGEDLRRDSIVRLAPGVAIAEQLFLRDDGGNALRRVTAARNRFNDRFQASPELEALFAILGHGCTYEDAERRFCEALAIDLDAHRARFRGWIELLADNALIEWRLWTGGQPPTPSRAGAACGG